MHNAYAASVGLYTCSIHNIQLHNLHFRCNLNFVG